MSGAIERGEAVAIAEKPARKDYGCPLRIYHDDTGRYTVLPPRSERAAAQWLHAPSPQHLPAWQGLQASGDGLSVLGGPAAFNAGPHLGKRIHWRDLPPEVQRFARLSFLGEYCPPGEQR